MIIHNNKNEHTELFSNGQSTDIRDWKNDEQSNELLKSSAIYRSVMIGDSVIYLLVEQADIDKIAKNYIYNEIHSSIYADNEYTWVNEILNYDGGDNYAIRFIHPNLKDTEGAYLSTDTKDINGNLPYLKELNVVKQNGEIVNSYYFKNKVNDEMTQKISYAKIYEPFNWVVATGKPMNDIFIYTDELKTYDKRVVNTTLIACLIFMIIIFLLSILIIFRVHRKYRKNIETYVKIETELDALTSTLRLKAAVIKLEEHLKRFKEQECNPVLLMLDLDNFKKINDIHSHDVGDIVLKKVSQTIVANITHDLKIPITIIQGYSRALKDGIVPEKEKKKYLDTIYKKSERIAELVSTFHEYSLLDHPDMPVNLSSQDICSIIQVYFANKCEELELTGFQLVVDIPEYSIECKLM